MLTDPAETASLPRSSVDHQSPHSSTSPGPPTEKNFTKSSDTPSRASTSAIPSGGLGEELEDLGEDHSDTGSQDRPSGRAQASLLLQQVSPGRDEDEASTAFTVNTSQTQDAGVSYYRAATGEDVTQEPGTLEPPHQETFEETFQLGRRLQSYYAHCACQTQAKADMVNRSKVLVKEEREQEALRKRTTRQDEKVASLRSMLQEEEKALEKRAAEIEREGIELLRRN